MTNAAKPLLWALGTLVLWTGTPSIAIETAGDNPYQPIVDRNVFGLKPPPPPPDPEANKPPPPKIKLQGITTILGKARALMKVQVPAKPPEPAKEVPYVLAEGQRDGDIEVLEIDPVAGIVKVNNFGTVTTLDFTNNSAVPATPPAPGTPPVRGGFNPAPGPNPPFMPAAVGKPPPTAREVRVAPTGAAVSPGSYGGARTSASYGGTPPLTTYTAVPAAPTYTAPPSVTVGGSGSATMNLSPGAPAGATYVLRPWPPEPTTAEEYAIRGAVYVQQNRQAIEQGLMPPVPGGNPLVDSGASSGHTTTPATTPTAPPLPPGAARRYVPQ